MSSILKSPKVYASTLRFLNLVLFLFVCWLLGNSYQVDFNECRVYIEQFPRGASGGIFVVLYVVVTFILWPAKDLFKVVGAVLYGAVVSTFLIWIAEIANAVLLFSLSRRLGRSFVEERSRRSFIERVTESNHWGALFALRLTHIVPFRFLDLLCGLTRISLRQYLPIVVLASPLPIFFIQIVLAGVGENVLVNPSLGGMFDALNEYYLNNQVVMWGGFVYVIFSIVVLIVLRKKFWNNRP